MIGDITNRVLNADITDKPEYFDHQFLRAAELQDERAYQLDRRWRHNRDFHLTGIVAGLEIDKGDAQGNNYLVTHGWAVDDVGRELVLPARTPLPVTVAGSIYVVWAENASHTSTDPGVAGTPDRTSEIPTLTIASTPPAHGVCLGRITGTSGSFSTDSTGRTEVGNFISTQDIQDGAVTSPKIAAADGTTLQDTTKGKGVKTNHLQDAAVTDAKLAGDAATSPKIAVADGTTFQDTTKGKGVKTNHLQDGAVTTAKLGNAAVESLKLAPADLTGSQDPNSGSGVKAGHLQNNAVTESKLDSGAVTSPKIAVAGTPADLQDTTKGTGIKTAHLQNDAVTSPKIAAAATPADGQDTTKGTGIKTPHLQDGAVTSQKIAVAATPADLQDTTKGTGIKTTHLQNNAVTSDKLQSDATVDANRAVNTNHIRDVAVTQAKLADHAVAVQQLKTTIVVPTRKLWINAGGVADSWWQADSTFIHVDVSNTDVPTVVQFEFLGYGTPWRGLRFHNTSAHAVWVTFTVTGISIT
jgi:hypothetical protein